MTAGYYSSLAADPDLGELVDLFVSEIPNRIAAISECLENDDWDRLRTLVHQLKGATGSYGFDEVSPIAAQAEHIVRQQQDEESIRRACQQLIDACQSMRAGEPA